MGFAGRRVTTSLQMQTEGRTSEAGGKVVNKGVIEVKREENVKKKFKEAIMGAAKCLQEVI